MMATRLPCRQQHLCTRFSPFTTHYRKRGTAAKWLKFSLLPCKDLHTDFIFPLFRGMGVLLFSKRSFHSSNYLFTGCYISSSFLTFTSWILCLSFFFSFLPLRSLDFYFTGSFSYDRRWRADVEAGHHHHTGLA